MATISFLFVDQVGSTDQLHRLGPDRAKPVRRALHELLVGAVTGNGGEVVDNTGDGVMAAFDSASSAIEAGVAMHRAAAGRNRRVPEDEAIRLRVGVHTGEVMADDSGRWFGMPVVIAARLCNAARTNEVLTSSVVAALIEGQIGYDLNGRGALDLKGVGTPVLATSVAWETATSEVALPAAVAAARRGMFTGRADLLHALDQTWGSVAKGARATCFLIGEPGIGKSRLASEVAYRAGLAGAVVVAGGCDADLAVPFRPFVSSLTFLVATVGRDRALQALGHPPSVALVKLIPELGPSGTGDDSIDPETERLQLFTEIDMLLSGGSECGVLLILDDLHWADDATLGLLCHLTRHRDGGPLMVLGTYRSSDVTRHDRLVELIADLDREKVIDRHNVGPLEAGDIARVVESIAGTAPPDDVAEALATATNGNPFFIEEIIRHLVDTSSLPGGDDEWRALPTDEFGLTERLRDVIHRRTERLHEKAQTMLRAAAVVGRNFSIDLLDRLEIASADDLLDAADAAVAARLIREVPEAPDVYRFNHALVRQALLEDLSSSRRLRMHRRIAEVLDSLPQRSATERAHHWRSAAGPSGEPRAVDASIDAAREAMEVLAFDRARQEYELALEHLGRLRGEPAMRARILLGLGEAAEGLPDSGEAVIAAFDNAAAAARESGDAVLLVEVALAAAGPPERLMHDVDGVVASLQEAADALDASGVDDAALRSRLYARLGAAMAEADPLGADALAAEAIVLAEQTRDDQLFGWAIRCRLRIWLDPRAPLERLALARRLSDRGRQIGDPSLAAWGVSWEMIPLLELGEMDAFEEALRFVDGVAATTRSPYRQWVNSYRRFALHLSAGRLDDADAVSADALATFSGTRHGSSVLLMWGNQQLVLRWLQGRLDELAFMMHLESGLPPELAAGVKAFVGSVVLPREEATTLLREAVSLHPALRTGTTVEWARHGNVLAYSLIMLSLHAFAALEIGDIESAERIADATAPIADLPLLIYPCTGSMGIVALPAALASAVCGRLEQAGPLFEQAIAAHRAMGNRPLIALGEYLSSFFVHDESLAASRREASIASAREIGMSKLFEGLAAAIDRL